MTPPAIPGWLRDSITAAGISGDWVAPEKIETAPGVAGAYVLILRLDRVVRIERPGGLSDRLHPGWYVYSGSARGSGGIRARIRRHFKRAKTPHWHIDWLTAETSEIAALAVPGGSECDLVDRLMAFSRFEVAAAGFGSTDCRRCESHLLAPVSAYPL